MWHSVFETAFGPFGFVARDQRLVATYLPGSRSPLERVIRKQWPGSDERASGLDGFRRSVIAYFEGEEVAFDTEVDLGEQPAFHQAVLRACMRIAYGSTFTYAQLATAVGRPGAARAVGTAMARNPMPLIVPCHRVVRSDGGLGGFSSPQGVKLKRRMIDLEHEAVRTPRRTLTCCA